MTINGKSAYVSYVSPTQLNVLAPDDPTLGSVTVQVTTAQGTSSPFTATKSFLSPAFFVVADQYVAAVHADGSYVGPPNLIPGVVTTPAKPGETISIFGTGFGPTSPALSTEQIVSQAEPLVDKVTVTIDGVTASVQYAGETAAGLDQFNVVVPSNLILLPDGDAQFAFNISGDTESGLLISVQQ